MRVPGYLVTLAASLGLVVGLFLPLPARAQSTADTKFAESVQRVVWKGARGHTEANCVDKAYEAVGDLVTAGWAPERLQYVVTNGWGRDLHMTVLIDGGSMLDSLSPWIEPLSAYRQHRIIARYPVGTDLVTLHGCLTPDGLPAECRR